MFDMEIIIFGGGTLAPSQFEVEATCADADSVLIDSKSIKALVFAGARRLSGPLLSILRSPLSIMDVFKHRIHVWYKMYNLKIKAR